VSHQNSLEANPEFVGLSKAVLAGRSQEVARELAARPDVLRRFPSESAQLLGLAVRAVAKNAGGFDVDSAWDEVQHALARESALLDLLIAHGADVDGEPHRQSPLHHAVAVGQPLLVDLLLESGSDPNVAHPGLGTPARIVEKRRGRVSAEAAAIDQTILGLLRARGAKDA
jgi:hypothetical protein